MDRRLRDLRQQRCSRCHAGFVLPLASAGALVLLLHPVAYGLCAVEP
jgi:hypothetical protein